MLIVDQAKHQVAAVAEIERRATAISMARAAAVGGVIRPQNCGPKHHVARPQQGAGDIARAIDQGCGISLVYPSAEGRLAKVGEGR